MPASPRRVLLTALPLLVATLPGCFSPTVDPDGSGSGTGGSSSGGTASGTATNPTTEDGTTSVDPTTGSSSGPADSSSTGPIGLGPEILSFTANGETNFQGLFAQGVDLELEASDPDGTIVRAEFWIDDEMIATQDGPGPAFVTEWLISGAVMNGQRNVRAVVEDNDGNTAEQTIIAGLDMPNGGFTDVWEDEGGFSYSIATDREGSAVIVGGIEQPSIEDGDAPVAQLDRVDGEAWATSMPGGFGFIADLEPGDDGEVWAVASRTVGGGTDTSLMHFNAAGNLVDTFDIDAGQDTPADGADSPVSLARLSGGDLVVHGNYVPSDGTPGLASYIARVTTDGEVVWLLRLTESADTTGEPFVNEVSVGANDVIRVAGSRPVAGPNQAWFGAVSADGEVQGQVTVSDFYESHAYATAASADGRYAFSGTQRDSNTGSWNRWLRVFDDGGDELWSRESTVDSSFGHAVAFDDFGNVLSVSTESCEFDLEDFSFGRCSLRVHKYDAVGELTWIATGLGGDQEFNGPVLFAPGIQADVMVDRYGYVYVSGLHRVPSPVRGDWWAGRINP